MLISLRRESRKGLKSIIVLRQKFRDEIKGIQGLDGETRRQTLEAMDRAIVEALEWTGRVAVAALNAKKNRGEI